MVGKVEWSEEERPSYDVHLVKGFSGSSVLAALRRKVDEIEDARAEPPAK
jgi:hypothetical protein